MRYGLDSVVAFSLAFLPTLERLGKCADPSPRKELQPPTLKLHLGVDGKIRVDRDGKFYETLENPEDVKQYLRFERNLDMLWSTPEEFASGKASTRIVLVVDEKCSFKQVHEIMQACRKGWYEEVTLTSAQAKTEFYSPRK